MTQPNTQLYDEAQEWANERLAAPAIAAYLRRHAILKRVESGESQSEVAQKTGLSRARISQMCIRARAEKEKKYHAQLRIDTQSAGQSGSVI